MPNTKNAMLRYKILDKLLKDHRNGYTLNELTELVSDALYDANPNSGGVGRRTIEKDLNYLKNGPYQAPIESYTVKVFSQEKMKEVTNKKFKYSDRSFSIFEEEMSDDEKYLVYEALSLLGQFEGIPGFERLERLRSSFGINRKSRKIVSFSKNPEMNPYLLGEFFNAISRRQVVRITYKLFSDLKTRRTVDLSPYLIKEYNRRWYVVGAPESGDILLTFAFDRIYNVEVLDGHPYLEYEGDISKAYDSIIGMTLYTDKPVEHITFWVSDRSKDYVRTKKIHQSQQYISGQKEQELRNQHPELEGGSFYSIDCRENYELIRELTSFGKELIVLSPDSIREKVIETVTGIYQAYTK